MWDRGPCQSLRPLCQPDQPKKAMWGGGVTEELDVLEGAPWDYRCFHEGGLIKMLHYELLNNGKWLMCLSLGGGRSC